MKKAFCFTIFPSPPLEKICPRVILVFPPSYLSREKLKKHFSASALPRPQKPFFSVFPFPFLPWGKTKITREQFFPQAEMGKKVKQNTISKA